LTVFVVLSLGMGACGDSSDDTTTGAKSATAEKLIDVNAMSRDQVKDGGTLRWPLDQFSSQ
jgi:hypothetical protein